MISKTQESEKAESLQASPTQAKKTEESSAAPIKEKSDEKKPAPKPSIKPVKSESPKKVEEPKKKPEEKPERQKSSLEKTSGNLKERATEDILKEIIAKGLTGKLEVEKDNLVAVVYIQDGKAIDATASDAVGDDAMVELLTWKEGHYSFEERVLRNNHTVYQSLESLLEQSRLLSNHIKELKDKGMLPTSTLKKKTEEFPEQDKSVGSAISEETLHGFYACLDGKHSIEDMTRVLQISRSKLIHLIHHLLNQDLVEISNKEEKSESLVLEPRPVDTAAIQTVMMSLRRADTGMFIYPAFLYFLEQEYFRSYRARTSFSVLVFEMREVSVSDGQKRRRPLEMEAIVEAVLRISKLKRHVDLLAHYDAYDYALLLPNTKAKGARIFCSRIIKALRSSPLAEVDSNNLSIAFGSASVPEDFKDLSAVLGAADLAMKYARDKELPLVLFKDIKELTTQA